MFFESFMAVLTTLLNSKTPFYSLVFSLRSIQISSSKKRMFTSSYNLFLKPVMLSKCIEVYVVSISRPPLAFDGLQEPRFWLWCNAIWVPWVKRKSRQTLEASRGCQRPAMAEILKPHKVQTILVTILA